MYFFFFNDTATTEIYTLSLHDALPISAVDYARALAARASLAGRFVGEAFASADLVALPTSPVGTPRIADTETGGDARFIAVANRMGALVGPSNYTGLPALSLPCGRDGNVLP